MALEATIEASSEVEAALTDIDNLASAIAVFHTPGEGTVHWSRRAINMCAGSTFRILGDFGLITNFGAITGTPTISIDNADAELTTAFKTLRTKNRVEFEISGGNAGISSTFTITAVDEVGRTVVGKGTIHVVEQSFGIQALSATIVATSRLEGSLS